MTIDEIREIKEFANLLHERTMEGISVTQTKTGELNLQWIPSGLEPEWVSKYEVNASSVEELVERAIAHYRPFFHVNESKIASDGSKALALNVATCALVDKSINEKLGFLSKEDVFKWACNFTDSIIAGISELPNEMTYCINKLQDSVYNHLQVIDGKLSDYLTQEYVSFRDKVREDRMEYVRNLMNKANQ